nr:synaptobrevin, longin-like domain protein [Tanacetum cinerariifolium]
MAALRHKDEHNKVGYLLKPTRSDDYHQIIDFLRASHVKYALTHNPIIFNSLVKQFWSTATLRSLELGPPAILATIDKTRYTITKYLVRSRLQLADDGGIADLPIADIYSGMDNLGTKSGSWDQFGSPLAIALICLSDGRRFNWSSYIFKGMVSNIGNAKKFLMYPRFLQTILGIETRITRQYKVLIFSSKLFANIRLNFAGHPMPLLPFMLLQSQAGEGAEKVHSLKTKLKDHKKLFKVVVGTLVKKVKALEVKLKTRKRKMVVSDSDQEDGRKKDVELDALRTLANEAVSVDSNAPSGGTSQIHATSPSVPTAGPPGASTVPPGALTVPPGASTVPPGISVASPGPLTLLAGCPSVPADVPSSVAPTGVSSKGKSLMVEEDILVKARTFKEMKEDIIGEEAAKRLHDEELAQMDRQRAEVEANASLSNTLLGDDVSEDNFPAIMAALIKMKRQALVEKLAHKRQNRPMTQAQQRAYMRQYIRKVQSNSQIQAFSRTLKRSGPVLEEPSSKRQQSTEAPIPSVPEVSQSPAVSSPPSSDTRKKSLARKRLPKPEPSLQELNLDADAQTFVKVVSNEDSDDEVPPVWSALVGWEVIDGSTTHFTTLRQILHMVDRQDLVKLYGLVVKYYENLPVASFGLILWGDLQVLSMFADVSYPLSVKLMEKMLTHKLEIDSDVVGNDMTIAEQLIQFIKNQLVAAQASSV